MGLFNFLKKKEVIEEVNEKDLAIYVNKLTNEKLSKFKTDLQEKKDYATYKLKKILEAIKELEESELSNKNIPNKEYQIMLGNKNNYVQRTKLFFQEITLPTDSLELHAFFKDFFEKLEALNNATQKNYFVLKHFFEDEIYTVARRIKEFEETIIKINELFEREKIDEIVLIKDDIKSIEKTRKKKNDLQQEQDQMNEQLNDLSLKKEKAELYISQLKKTTDYTYYNNFLKEKADLEYYLKKIKDEISSYFSDLERAMRKHSKITMNKVIVENYLTDCVTALLSDDNLEIVNELKKLKEELVHDKIELKDSKKEKSVEIIDKLNDAFLKDKIFEIKKIQDNIKETDDKIRKNITIVKLNDTYKFINELDKQIEVLTKKIQFTEGQIESLNIKLIKQKIQEKIYKHFSFKLIIK
ncbi:MAG: hypothetical protein QXG00_01410 [Candidatus Woesearchaeota archaeon]